jgi:hypothetical protein
MLYIGKHCGAQKTLFFSNLRASHLISEVNIMLTQNSKGKASRDGQRLRHRGQEGDRYTGLGKALGKGVDSGIGLPFVNVLESTLEWT